MPSQLKHFTDILDAGRDLTTPEAEAVFLALQNEPDEGPIADLLTAWNRKGPSVEEIYSLASLMRSRMKKIESFHPTFVDTAGTGSSRIKTFNISTAAAFVIRGAGIPVAKHGNRAATSRSGSADVISELGIKIDIEPPLAEECLNNAGICFMFAPHFHSLSRTLGKVRRGLGEPTIFNILGPLCNPAGAPHQIIGVWDESLVEMVAQVVARLGTQKTWVVNGGGLDEITVDGETLVAEVTGSEVLIKRIDPYFFSLPKTPITSLEKPTPAESATLIRSILDNTCPNEVARDLVLINAAAAIYITGRVKDASQAADWARESIETGAARAALDDLVEVTNR